MHAPFVLVMRSLSECNSMSSQTQPQKVQVAFLVTVNSMNLSRSRKRLLFSVRTGRDDERSPQLAAAVAAPNPPGHEPSRLDLGPGPRVVGRRFERRTLLGVAVLIRRFHELAPLLLPSPLTSAS